MMEDLRYNILYEFRLEGAKNKFFNIVLNPETISIIYPEMKNKPKWARLEYKQCQCCPLSKTEHPHCPIALNLSEIVHEFKGMNSSDMCVVRCTTPERTYIKKTLIMEGLSSIFGIIMATSDCPIMDFLKPMARFHLPFSTVEETMVRSTSMFLLRQYFEHKVDKCAYIDFTSLEKNYAKVHMVNEGLLRRINNVIKEDADKNAILTLHSLGKLLSIEIDYDLDSIKNLFTFGLNDK